MKRFRIHTLLGCILMAGAAGCEKSANEGDPQKNEPKAQVPASLFTEIKTAQARDVLAVKTDAKPGDEVIVRGNIAGSKDPFVAGRAMFTLADAKLPQCSEMDMGSDGCPTPWDLCCEPKDRLAAHTLTVEVDDAAGKALAGTLRDVGGLAPGKAVIVRGHVTQASSPNVMIIRADGISVGS